MIPPGAETREHLHLSAGVGCGVGHDLVPAIPADAARAGAGHGEAAPFGEPQPAQHQLLVGTIGGACLALSLRSEERRVGTEGNKRTERYESNTIIAVVG